MELFIWLAVGATWISVTCTGIWLVRTARNLARISAANDFMSTLLDVAAARMEHAEYGLDLLIAWVNQEDGEDK